MWHFGLLGAVSGTQARNRSMKVTRVLDVLSRSLALALGNNITFAYHFPRHTLSGLIPHRQSALPALNCKYREK